MSTIKVFFYWNLLRPDKREFKQQSIELTPFVGMNAQKVAVEIEFNAANVDNFDEISKYQEQANVGALYAETQKMSEPEAVLTAAGMVAAMAVFERLLHDVSEPADFRKPDTENGWGAAPDWGATETTAKAPQEAVDEDWGEETSKDDVPWEEDDWSEK